MAPATMPAAQHKLVSASSAESRTLARPVQARGQQQTRDNLHSTRDAADGAQRSSVFDELVNEIGIDAAARLIDIFGGTRLYIPHSPDEDDLLTASLGKEAALKLARIYGGDRLEVPNPTPRRARIIELRETGCSVDAIARKLGCTRRRVFQVLAEARATKRSA